MYRSNPWLADVVASITLPARVASSSSNEDPHAESVDINAMQQIVKDEGKTIVPPAKVKASTGPELERWKLAAEAELTKNFKNTHAYHDPRLKRSKHMGDLCLC